MNKILDEIQHVIDRLHSEGHTVATRLENALLALKGKLAEAEKVAVTEAEALTGEVVADVAKDAADAAPVVAEAKQQLEEVKGQVEKDLKETADTVVGAVQSTTK